MSELRIIERNPTSEPKAGVPLPERLIAGNPAFRTWLQDTSHGGKVRTGVWEASPGEYRSIKGGTFEFCTILEGVVELTEDGQAPRRFKAGDSLVMKPDFKGNWKTIETVRKIYVSVD